MSEEENIIGELSKSLESLTMAEGGVSDNENGESKKVSMSEEKKPDIATIRGKIECCKEMNSDQLKEEKDDTTIRRKEELKQNTQTMQQLTSMMQEIVKSNVSTVELKSDIQKLIKEYQKFEKQHQKYANQLKHKANTREVKKYKVFQQSQLNIKLEKFQGYNSSLNIYTFKSEFEKLHLNSTSRKLLPDLLKNNFLTNQAYALDQCVEDINQIWTQLIAAYSDTRHMLNTKLHSINKLKPMWKLKQPEKVTGALAKVAKRLAKQHNTEEKLYHGGLQQIYKLLGDGRVTRWLSTICDEQLEDKKVWEKLILFLEKEMKIQQQRILISSRSTTELKDTRGCNELHLVDTNEKVINSECFICGENNHIKTEGPGGTQLVQYFSCKKIAEMTPAQKFTEL